MRTNNMPVSPEKEVMFIVKLTLLALFVRFCIGATYYNIFVAALKKPLYALDGEAYSIAGWYIALVLKGVNIFMLPPALIPNDYSVIGGLFGAIESLHGTLPHIQAYGIGIYSYLIGFFYYIFGYVPVLLRFFNSTISVLSAFIVYIIARRNFNVNTARIAFIIAAFMPSFVLYSASLQRDTLINFLVLLIICLVPTIGKRRGIGIKIISITAISTACILLIDLRPNAVMVILACMVILLCCRFALSFKYITGILAALLFIIRPIRIYIIEYAISKMQLMANYHLGLTALGGSVFRLLPEHYYKDVAVSVVHITARDLLYGYFNGLRSFFLEPFVFRFHELQHLLAFPQMIIWYVMVFFGIVGIYFSFKKFNFERFSLFIFLFIFSSTIGLSEANIEALIRHRDMIVPIYIVFAAYGIEALMSNSKSDSVTRK